ncbi:DEAD/DEAH box helicase [Trueperella sp. LYQ143]|uniref:DEAD/DEAH box helicase n=1 Tax=Trueperella sp. LYQ143 TaxID=3391059 RepID=UPI0039836CE3
MTDSHIARFFIDRYAQRGIILDDFQRQAMRALEAGHDVLVCAPTGSGKTVVAEYAVELALAREQRCIYTAPIKALSNQKFRDLCSRIGAEHVGLLTGDQTIRRHAPILVVTTEVLRNMLFVHDDMISDVGYVVLDEVHYLADPFRGPVWEEIILQLPAQVRLVSLSATIANVEEFSRWLTSVRGEVEVIVSQVRPVPLQQHVAVGHKLLPLYGSSGEVSAALRRADERMSERRSGRIGFSRRKRILDILGRHDLLPAIEFIFSRKGCDRAVSDLLEADITLTTSAQQKQIGQRLSTLRAALTAEDRRTVRFEYWAQAMRRGYCAHHAGIFPPLKELAEDLMEAGLLKLVYATGTLALGIDMPVRTVVLEETKRWNGADFVDLSATEYTQLIGRAGRRGRDQVGHAVVMHSSDLDVDYLADLGSGRVDPLLSAFFPSYNSVVNLLAYHDYAQARAIMGTSFAQFQRNADLGQMRGRIARLRARLAQLEESLQDMCEYGDVLDYIRARERGGRASKSARRRAKEAYRLRIIESWNGVRTGRVYAFACHGELDYAVVLSVGSKRLRIIDVSGALRWLYFDDLSSALREVADIDLPFGISVKDREVRRDIASRIDRLVRDRFEWGADADLEMSWDRFADVCDPAVHNHPVHQCPHRADHIEYAAQWVTLHRQLAHLEEQSESFDDSVAKEFDATVRVLGYLGYIQGIPKDTADFTDIAPRIGRVKLAGGAQLLRGVHSEADLLICLSLAQAQLRDLTPAEFAGVMSVFLADRRLGSGMPTRPALRRAWRAIERDQEYLTAIEAQQGITRTPELFTGAMDAFCAWAEGAQLEHVLRAGNFVVGDFISANRRLIDLLGQVEMVEASEYLTSTAHQARLAITKWTWL